MSPKRLKHRISIVERSWISLVFIGALCLYPADVRTQDESPTSNGLVLRYLRPFGMEGILTIVNGEQSGYIQARIRTQTPSNFGGGYVPLDVYAESLDQQLRGRTHLELGGEQPFAVQVKTEISDPDGKKKKVKVLKILRAGPGEQLGIGLSVISISGLSARVSVQAQYYSEDGVLVGSTSWIDFDLQSGRRDSKSFTFRRGDLVGSH